MGTAAGCAYHPPACYHAAARQSQCSLQAQGFSSMSKRQREERGYDASVNGGGPCTSEPANTGAPEGQSLQPSNHCTAVQLCAVRWLH